jgi:hypothetical protein
MSRMRFEAGSSAASSAARLVLADIVILPGPVLYVVNVLFKIISYVSLATSVGIDVDREWKEELRMCMIISFYSE